ncbi:gamma-glutamyl ligase [Candidatus Wolfebacteria bacterium]|nr:MAG: gamma-glutamyl ligase [Candidatus Wolfebacteria bacterium]
MQIIPIHTRVLTPPKDDLLEVIKESISEINEKSILVVSSKVVAIHEGRCISSEKIDKVDLIKQEADKYLPNDVTPDRKYPVTITNHVILGSAGVDESNGNGYYILLPKDSMKSAEEIRDFIKSEYHVKDVGVIITDSYSTPMRRGAINISLGYAGFNPLVDYRGEKDIFDRSFQVSVANVVDGLAAASGVSMGEGSTQTPLSMITSLPKSIEFTEVNTMAKDLDFFVDMESDRFKFLLDKLPWQKGGSDVK